LNDSITEDKQFLKAAMIDDVNAIKGREEGLNALRETYKSIIKAK